MSEEQVGAAAKAILDTPGDYPGDDGGLKWATMLAEAALNAAAAVPLAGLGAEWALSCWYAIYPYESEAEARHQLVLAQMDAPAVLVTRAVTPEGVGPWLLAT